MLFIYPRMNPGNAPRLFHFTTSRLGLEFTLSADSSGIPVLFCPRPTVSRGMFSYLETAFPYFGIPELHTPGCISSNEPEHLKFFPPSFPSSSSTPFPFSTLFRMVASLMLHVLPYISHELSPLLWPIRTLLEDPRTLWTFSLDCPILLSIFHAFSILQWGTTASLAFFSGICMASACGVASPSGRWHRRTENGD